MDTNKENMEEIKDDKSIDSEKVESKETDSGSAEKVESQENPEKAPEAEVKEDVTEQKDVEKSSEKEVEVTEKVDDSSSFGDVAKDAAAAIVNDTFDLDHQALKDSDSAFDNATAEFFDKLDEKTQEAHAYKQESKEEVVSDISEKTAEKGSASEVGETTEAKNANSEVKQEEAEMVQ